MIKNGHSLWDKSSLIFDQDCMMDKHLDRLKEILMDKCNIPVFVANIYTQESILLTDLHILSSLLCKKYKLGEDYVSPLFDALNSKCNELATALRNDRCDCRLVDIVHQYEGQYIDQLNNYFDAKFKKDTASLTVEIHKYIAEQPVSKLAKKEDVERVINEAGKELNINFNFNIENDFYELVKLSSMGLIFKEWNEVVEFMSK